MKQNNTKKSNLKILVESIAEGMSNCGACGNYRKLHNGVNENNTNSQYDFGPLYDAMKRNKDLENLYKEYTKIDYQIAKLRVYGDRKSDSYKNEMAKLESDKETAWEKVDDELQKQLARDEEELERKRQAVVNRNSAVRKSGGLYNIDTKGGTTTIGGDAVDYANRKYGSLDGEIEADPDAKP